MKWTDIYDIAIELADAYPDTDPQYINFVDLRNWIIELSDFDDDQIVAEKKSLKLSSLPG